MQSIAQASTATPNPSDQRNAADAFDALVAEHGLTVEEWDTATLDASLRNKFVSMLVESKGGRILVVPAGQNPDHRLAAVRALLAHPGVTA